jgi:hypothetical protein
MATCCERCGYNTTKTFALKRHLTKKTPCLAVLCDVEVTELYNKYFPPKEVTPFVCDYCKKCFANRHNKSRHMKQCSEQFSAMQAQIATLQKQLQDKIQYIQNINGNVTNNYNTTNNNIQINAFGKENLQYLLESPDFENYIINILKKKREGLLILIEDMYFNPAHPENHTINKRVKNDKFISCFDGEKWNTKLLCEVMEEILLALNININTLLNKIHRDDDDDNITPLYLKYKKIFRQFMSAVGDFLNFEFDWEHYQADEDNKFKNEQRNMIELVFGQFLYERSKTIFKPS